jgi:cytochrome c551/c552
MFALSLGLSISLFASPLPEAGKTIFTGRCAACHSVNKQLTGPALAGLSDRRSIDWIIKFVQSSQSVIKSGDKDAVALFTQFNRIPMPDHADLTGEDIKNIVEYIKSETVTTTSEDVPFAKPASLRPNYLPLSIHNYGFFTVILGLIGLLIASLVAWVRVKEYARENSSAS